MVISRSSGKVSVRKKIGAHETCKTHEAINERRLNLLPFAALGPVTQEP